MFVKEDTPELTVTFITEPAGSRKVNVRVSYTAQPALPFISMNFNLFLRDHASNYSEQYFPGSFTIPQNGNHTFTFIPKNNIYAPYIEASISMPKTYTDKSTGKTYQVTYLSR